MVVVEEEEEEEMVVRVGKVGATQVAGDTPRSVGMPVEERPWPGGGTAVHPGFVRVPCRVSTRERERVKAAAWAAAVGGMGGVPVAVGGEKSGERSRVAASRREAGGAVMLLLLVLCMFPFAAMAAAAAAAAR